MTDQPRTDIPRTRGARAVLLGTGGRSCVCSGAHYGCPHCAACCGDLAAGSTGSEGMTPHPGAATVCAYCRMPALFVAHPLLGLTLRKPTDTEAALITQDPGFAEAMAAIDRGWALGRIRRQATHVPGCDGNCG